MQRSIIAGCVFTTTFVEFSLKLKLTANVKFKSYSREQGVMFDGSDIKLISIETAGPQLRTTQMQKYNKYAVIQPPTPILAVSDKTRHLCVCYLDTLLAVWCGSLARCCSHVSGWSLRIKDKIPPLLPLCDTRRRRRAEQSIHTLPEKEETQIPIRTCRQTHTHLVCLLMLLHY